MPLSRTIKNLAGHDYLALCDCLQRPILTGWCIHQLLQI